MKKFLTIVLLIMGVSSVKGIIITQVQNRSPQEVFVVGDLYIDSRGVPITPERAPYVIVMTYKKSYWLLIESSKEAGSIFERTPEVHTSKGTFPLGNSDIRTLTIKTDGSVDVDGKILQ